MKSLGWFVWALAAFGAAIAVAPGCSSDTDSGTAPPLSGGTGGADAGTSSGTHPSASSSSSSQASSSSASSSSSQSSASTASGAGGGGANAGGAGGAGGSGGSGGLPLSCTDNTQDGAETDVDCGGDVCPPCDEGEKCITDTDCASMSCVGNLCALPSCNDGVKNGTETDVDCGGSCPPCTLAGDHCIASADCSSGVCMGNECQSPGCTDGVKNGTETDVDCGGLCPACAPGHTCVLSSDCQGNFCQSGQCECPSDMVTVPEIGGGKFCIEPTEVTYSAYQIFYSANPATSTQPSFCLWNANYTPTGDWPQDAQHASFPVRYVNWCQADAYCRYNGRHLCGAIAGGSVATNDLVNASIDQWFDACTAQGGPNVYPYGATYNGTKCNGIDAGQSSAWSTITQTCEGGEPSLFDMSGNLAEWEDGCTGGSDENDLCPVRGGSFESDEAALRCDSGGTIQTELRDYAAVDVGFRCCL